MRDHAGTGKSQFEMAEKKLVFMVPSKLNQSTKARSTLIDDRNEESTAHVDGTSASTCNNLSLPPMDFLKISKTHSAKKMSLRERRGHATNHLNLSTFSSTGGSKKSLGARLQL